jgi:hypothetical protein
MYKNRDTIHSLPFPRYQYIANFFFLWLVHAIALGMAGPSAIKRIILFINPIHRICSAYMPIKTYQIVNHTISMRGYE